ncbi:hypothetical protein [Alishewanella sp. HL-SH05]|uniref:hypothetical protein n=1 Tax=Alishewanella sp. HL-SH05 TaxID=3461145 RepID=UPI00404107D5
MPMNRLKHLLLPLSILVLVACGDANIVSERGVYWKSELESRVPIGTSREEALTSLKKIDANAFVNPLSDSISTNLETVKDDGFACKDWVITANTSFNSNGVSGHSIASVGRCL